MTTQEKKIMRYQYWKLLVAQSANIDEFGEKNYNIDQRLLALQDLFFALHLGVPFYDDLDRLIRKQTWRFNIDETGAHYYTYIDKDGETGIAKDHMPKDLTEYVDTMVNGIR